MLGERPQRQHAQVGKVRAEVGGHHQEPAQKIAAGQHARRVLHLARRIREHVPALVGPKHSDQRHPEGDPGGVRRGERLRRDHCGDAPGEQSQAHNNCQAREFGEREDCLHGSPGAHAHDIDQRQNRDHA